MNSMKTSSNKQEDFSRSYGYNHAKLYHDPAYHENNGHFLETNGIFYSQNEENSNESGRKTKSKEAARTRRNKENEEFKILSQLLPLQLEITQQLDKASVIRLAISYIRIRNLFDELKIPNSIYIKSYRSYAIEKFETNQSLHACLDGFLFLLSSNARFMYVSESISQYLGLSQVVLIGTSIFELIHEDDRIELAHKMGIKNVEGIFNTERLNEQCQSPSIFDLSSDDSNFKYFNQNDKILIENSNDFDETVVCTVRVKSILLKRAFPQKYSGWRILQIIGRRKCKKSTLGFFGIALSVQNQIMQEISLSSSQLVICLNQELTIESIERNKTLKDFNYHEFIGRSFFHLIHPQDLKHVTEELVNFRKKESCVFSFRLAYDSDGDCVYSNCTIMYVALNKSGNSSNSATEVNGIKNQIIPAEDIKLIAVNEIYYVNSSEIYRPIKSAQDQKTNTKNATLPHKNSTPISTLASESLKSKLAASVMETKRVSHYVDNDKRKYKKSKVDDHSKTSTNNLRPNGKSKKHLKEENGSYLNQSSKQLNNFTEYFKSTNNYSKPLFDNNSIDLNNNMIPKLYKNSSDCSSEYQHHYLKPSSDLNSNGTPSSTSSYNSSIDYNVESNQNQLIEANYYTSHHYFNHFSHHHHHQSIPIRNFYNNTTNSETLINTLTPNGAFYDNQPFF